MTEATRPFPMTEAVAELQTLSTLSPLLRARTEGLGWAVLALIAAALLVADTMAYTAALGGGTLTAVIAPFAIMGIGTLWTIQRTHAVASRSQALATAALLASVLSVAAALLASSAAPARQSEPAWALMLVGTLPWLLVATARARMTAVGRRIGIALGVVGVGGGGGLLLWHAGPLAALWTGLGVALVWTAAGVWQALRA